MPSKITRREMFRRLAGAAGLLAQGRLPLALSSESASVKSKLPDKSETAPTSPVAILRCESFEPELFRKKLDALLDQIGGIQKLVHNKTVTVKINMTGMTWDPVFGLPPYETSGPPQAERSSRSVKPGGKVSVWLPASRLNPPKE